MATVSYGMKITSAFHVFDKTIEIYRAAIKYLTNVVSENYGDISCISDETSTVTQRLRRQYVEKLIHSTKNNEAVYPSFDSWLRLKFRNSADGPVAVCPHSLELMRNYAHLRPLVLLLEPRFEKQHYAARHSI